MAVGTICHDNPFDQLIRDVKTGEQAGAGRIYDVRRKAA